MNTKLILASPRPWMRIKPDGARACDDNRDEESRSRHSKDHVRRLFRGHNYAADGGLYGELVKNRSFEFPQSLMGWQTFGNVKLKNDGPFEALSALCSAQRCRTQGTSHGSAKRGLTSASACSKARTTFHRLGKSRQRSIEDNGCNSSTKALWRNVEDFVSATLDITSADWKKYELILKSPKTDNNANLRIFLDSKNAVALEHISLFPVNTFKNRENGMRRDLGQALADVHPGVLRFPGGCIVEGETRENRYQWKNTIGPVENRPLNRNRWEFTFDHRYFPDYFQSYGLGFFEYSNLPKTSVPSLCRCSMWAWHANTRTGTTRKAHVAWTSSSPTFGDCLDLIEFANGDTTTVWGRKRAEMGHPAPFNMKYLAVGKRTVGESLLRASETVCQGHQGTLSAHTAHRQHRVPIPKAKLSSTVGKL